MVAVGAVLVARIFKLVRSCVLFFFFFFNDTATTEIYTLSLHDALPIFNRLMLRLARRGLNVVRLKGGDPSIFGRVGEEREFLESHGVDVEVVPGVTAASAAAAQFGVSLTHRGEARRLLGSTATVSGGELPEDRKSTR